MSTIEFGNYKEFASEKCIKDELLGMIEARTNGFTKGFVDSRGHRFYMQSFEHPSLKVLRKVKGILNLLDLLVNKSINAIEAPEDYHDEEFRRDKILLRHVLLQENGKIQLSFSSCFRNWHFYPIAVLEMVGGTYHVCFWDWSC